MSNVLGDTTQQQVLALGRLGWSLRRIEQATTVRRETASAYLKAAGIPVRERGGRPKVWPPKPATTPEVSTDPGPSKPATTREVSTDSPRPSSPGRTPSASACEPYRELIAEALGRGRNAMAIWQDLVDDHGFVARYASVRRFVVTLRAAAPAEARVVITTPPGEEGQVDYGGDGPMVRDETTGKYRRVRLFVLTLGFSRKCVRLLTWRSSAQIWAELHERAFRRLGGTVKVIVLDNLGEGVLTPDIYDPALNPLYRDVLAHYGVVALPCRVGDPDRKGKVEAGVGHAQKTRARARRADLSLPAEVPRPPATGAPHPAPSRPPHSAAHPLSRSHQSQNRRPAMNLVELDRALRQLRLSGMAAVLETRLRQAQTEKVTPIDLVSMLVSDELLRRQDRLLERRHKLARFRDPDRSLDTFDFDFNKKMNRALIHELATGRFIAQREDALFLGPPGTGKSHLAQAIGRAVIQQGYRVIYREAHTLLEELADATLDGTRKTYLADLAAVPLLIIDDLGMRKLPHTAAEDLLEIIMRRYERAATLLTSNRPVDDWGKLLGDTAAVTALLDRLLHHAHVLKCGPRSWRTKVHTDLRTEEATK